MLTLAPNNADVLSTLGSGRLLCAEIRTKAVLLPNGRFVSIRRPRVVLRTLARTMFIAGRYAESLSSLRKSPPDNLVTLMFRALCHASLGEMTQRSRLPT